MAYDEVDPSNKMMDGDEPEPDNCSPDVSGTRADAPSIGQISELHEPRPEIDPSRPLESKPLSRRDLLKAAAALGIGAGVAGAASAVADERGEISYVICNRALNEAIAKAEFSPGHSRLAALGKSGQLLIWDAKRLAKPLEKISEKNVADFAWGRKERLLIWDSKGSLKCYDGRDQKLLFNATIADLKLASFTPDGNQVVALDKNWRIRILDSTTGTKASELDLSQKISALDSGARPAVNDVNDVGMTIESPSRVYIATKRSVLLARVGSSQVETLANPVRNFDELVISDNGELIGYLRKAEKTFDTFRFPSVHPWKGGLRLNAIENLWAFSPTFDYFVTASKDKLRVQKLGIKPEEKPPLESNADLGAVTCIACAWDPGVFVWGGDDGRVVTGKEGATPPSEQTASSGSRRTPAAPKPVDPLLKTVAMDASLNKIKEYKPGEVKLPYGDCTCTCNSVTVTSSHNERISQVWDSAHEKWITSTQPCGTPIPAGAICVCNCVSAPSSPLWTTICTCNTVCTCNTQGGRTLTYWY